MERLFTKEELEKLPVYSYNEKILQRKRYMLKEDIVYDFPNNFQSEALDEALKNDSLEYTATSGTISERMQIIRRRNWWQDEYKRTYKNHPLLKAYLEDSEKKKIILTTAVCSNLVCYMSKPSYEERIINDTLYVNMSSNPWTWTQKDIEQIIDEFEQYQPYYLDADPVYLSALLILIDKYGITKRLYEPVVITLSYEYVTTNVMKFIKSKMPSAEIINLYGTTEFGYVFVQNDKKEYIICPELINVEYSLVCASKGIYALIIDSYKNEYMPLYNYRVGDIVKACQIGETHKHILKFAGREKDICQNKITGENVFLSELDDLLEKYPDIVVYQLYIINETIGILNYTTYNLKKICEEQEQQIEYEIKNLYGLNCKINLRLFIEPEMSGKFAIIKKA